MADESFTLTTFYSSWQAYQERMAVALAPLTAEQLALRAAPNLRSIGENAAHIIGCRAGWFIGCLGERADAEMQSYPHWDDPGAPARTADELVDGLNRTWRLMETSIARWNDTDMQQTFPDDWGGQIVQLPRAWVVWHVLEHDLHHGGELALTFGMHGLPSDFPG